MKFLKYIFLITLISLSLLRSTYASSKVRNYEVQYYNQVSTFIIVDKSGQGNFTTIQQAIDSIPNYSKQWVRIHIKADIYNEKVFVPKEKQYIMLEGEGMNKSTVLEYGDGGDVTTSHTFKLLADNFVARNIIFKNTYNDVVTGEEPKNVTWAPAVTIYADKVSFYNCGFISLQDTLSDIHGRHYFENCYIEGAIDFIWGNGQSLYKNCILNVTVARLGGHGGSYITAQGRESEEQTSGFVFHTCNVVGTGLSYLGRAYRNHSRVLFFNTYMDNIINPLGWSAWYSNGIENLITYAEMKCSGPGSDMSKRVEWEKKLSEEELECLIDIDCFINQDEWLNKQPIDIYN